MDPFCQVAVAKALGSGLKAEHVLPVGTHPDKDREGQRNGDKGQQDEIQQAHLVQEIEVGHRANRQHIVAARDTLDKGVLIVQRHDVTPTKALHGRGIQVVLFQRFDAQFEGQIQIQLLNGARPVVRRDLTQFATHQIERAFHQVIQRLPARALGGEFVDQPDQHGHYQEADKQQEVKLHEQLFHYVSPKYHALMMRPDQTVHTLWRDMAHFTQWAASWHSEYLTSRLALSRLLSHARHFRSAQGSARHPVVHWQSLTRISAAPAAGSSWRRD